MRAVRYSGSSSVSSMPRITGWKGSGFTGAAGDATEFAIKHGGVGSQQADAVAESIAALAGAPVKPEPFHPVIRGMLLTDEEPLYLTARITGGQGFSSEVSETPLWSPPSKIATKYLSPYLERVDHAAAEPS